MKPRAVKPEAFTRTSSLEGFPSLTSPRLVECLDALAEEVDCASHLSTLVWPKVVDYLDGLPDPLTFYRDYVAPGRPCIIRNAFNDWPALKKWSSDYLSQVCGSAPISVDVTPSGRGDCLIQRDKEVYFVQPEQRQTTLGEALKSISATNRDLKAEKENDSGIYYVQKQNDSFRLEYEALWKDVPDNVQKWGCEVFGLNVDAINWWCGPDEAVSSMHKDPYDNLYCVVKGTKLFTLLPQSAYPYLHTTFGRPSHYVNTNTRDTDPSRTLEIPGHPKWKVECDSSIEGEESVKVPWISVDVDDPESVRNHTRTRSLNPEPLKVVVQAGEMLYLPSLVFHRVAQRRGSDEFTCAVNYWFDMKHDMRYCYLQFLEKMLPPIDPTV